MAITFFVCKFLNYKSMADSATDLRTSGCATQSLKCTLSIKILSAIVLTSIISIENLKTFGLILYQESLNSRGIS
ncbi:hypothetical protein BHE16_04680 [Neomicrococcus aestuarii]|uniref:Uncharacterized protein n=1 Tax=Neomicrococcus aestuarii TaxID=556325 RepID=A0A1L2ZLV5_9MICC|nr:hypothetical protein BHE16_04680 [Neomicrococcus aestuarii]